MKTPSERNIVHEFDETILWRQPKRIHVKRLPSDGMLISIADE